jgi:hypothetical protein
VLSMSCCNCHVIVGFGYLHMWQLYSKLCRLKDKDATWFTALTEKARYERDKEKGE